MLEPRGAGDISRIKNANIEGRLIVKSGKLEVDGVSARSQ
jgi:hypothetical protein